jgi:hypothetical protein
MKLTTITLPAIEMTREEEKALWRDYPNISILGVKVLDWNTDDGHNIMRLEGNDFYHAVVILAPDCANAQRHP